MKILAVAQIVVSALLMGAVLMQNKGEGLGAIAGGFGGSYHTRRGFEKFLMQSTVVLGVLFVVLAALTVKYGI